LDFDGFSRQAKQRHLQAGFLPELVLEVLDLDQQDHRIQVEILMAQVLFEMK